MHPAKTPTRLSPDPGSSRATGQVPAFSTLIALGEAWIEPAQSVRLSYTSASPNSDEASRQVVRPVLRRRNETLTGGHYPTAAPSARLNQLFPNPGTVSPLVARHCPLGPCKTAVSPTTSRTTHPSMVLGLVSGTGVCLGTLRPCLMVIALGRGDAVFCCAYLVDCILVGAVAQDWRCATERSHYHSSRCCWSSDLWTAGTLSIAFPIRFQSDATGFVRIELMNRTIGLVLGGCRGWSENEKPKLTYQSHGERRP